MTDWLPRLQKALADRYSIDREIGRGGMSIVYLARDLPRNRFVALKVFRPDIAAVLGPDRFLDEIQVAAGLAHPHILPLFDSDVADGLLFYTMPYVEGESLRQRLTRERRLPVAEAVSIACDVAEALSYAHAKNIVHRDIKPENILLEAGHPVISDFGIARAIREADESRKTGTGLVIGTVGYMSPEQATGQKEIDGRSDIYSLGCVLYEMLVGRTPSDARTSLISERQDVPIEIQLAIETALAEQPGERYATAGEFATALRLPQTASSSSRQQRIRRRWRAAAVVAAVMLGTAGAIVLPRLRASPLDALLYVVVPFTHREGAAPKLITGDRCESLLVEAFSRWEDVRLVDDLRVHDLHARTGADAGTLDQAFAIARALGSGQLVWGDVAQFGDTVQVRAALYDVRRGSTIRNHSVRFPANASDINLRFRELADSLLLGHVRSQDDSGAVLGTRFLAAWQAYADGQVSLGKWDLEGAERGFRRAIELDPDYAHAHLWLAQTLEWGGRPVASWRPFAVTSAAVGGRLGFRERALARALADLANNNPFQSCAEYRRLLARDSLDFVAWFGLGDCQTRDKLVVRDPQSVSGWRFRSSYRAAASAYQRALELIPSVHRAFTGVAFTRLTALFHTEAGIYRGGYALTPDTIWFGSWPAVDHDTLAFTPVPLADLVQGREGAIPASISLALTRNRDLLRGVTLRWVHAFPNSPDAYFALSKVLETTGDLFLKSNPEGSALASVRRALQLSTDSVQRLELAVAEVRLFLKLGEFDSARIHAESALTVWKSVGPAQSSEMAGLAALTGHVFMTADLLQRSAAVDTQTTLQGAPILLPKPAVEQALKLVAYAAFGAPRESLLVARTRTEQQINIWVEQRQKAQARGALLLLPSMLAFPEVGVSTLHRTATADAYLIAMQAAFARGDSARLRNSFAWLDSLRKNTRPGDLGVSSVYLESWLLLASKDTAAAIRRIDPFLEALPTIGLHVVEEAAETVMLVRLMALRADLADRRGEYAVARRWGQTVAALWTNADDALQPTVQRMRRFASGREMD